MSRRSSLVATCDQWVRATHAATAVGGTPASLTLSWQEPEDAPGEGGGACPARGLAVDRLCRVYRLAAHHVERVVVGPTGAGLDYGRLRDPVTIIGSPADAAPACDFRPASEPPLLDATGIAVDADDRLYIADRGRGHIAVIDLWSRRTLRTARVLEPMGLAAAGRTVYAAVRDPAGLVRLTATDGPAPAALPAGAAGLPPGAAPSRVAVLPDGVVAMLWHDPGGTGWIVAGDRPPLAVGSASDIAVDAEGALVVAPCPPLDAAAPVSLHRLVPTGTGWTRALPLDAAGYDGSGIVVTADGRVAYWTAGGLRLATRRAVSYARDGVCVTYRLDSGVARNRWGRLVIDACIPPGTDVRVATLTSDDQYETAVPYVPALPAACEPADPAATPALPPAELVPGAAAVTAALHRRRDAVTPWWRPVAGDGVDLWDAPVASAPGRYCWVMLRLAGDGRATPAVRELRVEHRSHDLVDRLPALYADDALDPSFLHRFLATFDGLLYDFEQRSAARDLLVDPASVPVEALDWLACMVGLVLDDRWPEAARRALVDEIVPLYRRRGTVWALSRYLELYLGVPPVIVEDFRMPKGRPHRFSLLIPRPLSADDEAVVRHVLDQERPAHTDYVLCTVDAGMRVGRGLHLGLSSMVGPTGDFAVAVTGQARLGPGTLLGGRTTGAPVEAARVGRARLG